MIYSDSSGSAGNDFSASHSYLNGSSPRPNNRGRVRGNDFGLPQQTGLIDLARTYLEAQKRLWPELVGTAAVPAAIDTTVEAMAADFERRFRAQIVDVFRPGSIRPVWLHLGLAYVRFSDEGSNPRSVDQQLLNILNRARRDSVFIPWQYVCADAAVSGALACRRGYTIAKMMVEHREQTGVAWFITDDLSRMNRNTIESLRLGELAEHTDVRLVGASDGFDSSGQQSKIMLPVMSSINEIFIDQLKSKVKRGMDDAFRRGENIQPPGVGYRLVPLKDADGDLVITHKGTIEKVVEIDEEAADWTRRAAVMIAHEGKSAMNVARLFNEHTVGGKQTWTDGRVRQHYGRERLVGKDVLHKTKQVLNRQTGKKKVVHLPPSDWIWRDSPHLRILSDELANAVKQKLGIGTEAFGKKATDQRKKTHRVDLYPKVLIRPVCGCCGDPMILGRSSGKYQSFFCFNAISGVRGCTNRGYKSARIIDEAVLSVVMATLFTEGFITDLTANVNTWLAEITRRPLPSTKKLEQDIANEDRRLKRLTDRLAQADDKAMDAVLTKADEMERQLKAKRQQLAEMQRQNHRPKVKSIKEKDVVAALTKLRDLLQGDVGVAAQVLKALLGDVVVQKQHVDGYKKPQMVARFTINAIPALAVLDRGTAEKAADASIGLWNALHRDQHSTPASGTNNQGAVVSLGFDRKAAARAQQQPRDGTS